jgi:hypothetical protein
MTSSCDEPYIDEPKKNGEPKNTITVKEASVLATNFNTRHEAMSELIGKPDNRSSWYSLSEIKEYIAYIENEGATKGLDVDGVRIYFGAYNEDRGNYSTLVFVPTIRAKTTDNNKGEVKRFMAVEEMSEDTEKINPLNFGNGGRPPEKSISN